MKKSLCLLALLGAFTSMNSVAATGPNDQTVEVTFTGRVSESTCEINLANGGRELDLGTVKKAGQDWATTDRGALVPVIFSITNCDKTGVAKVELTQDILGVNHDKSDVANGTLATTQKPFVVQLYKGMDGQDKGLIDNANMTFPGSGPTYSGDLLVGYAALQHNGDPTAVQASDLITAKAMFTLTFN